LDHSVATPCSTIWPQRSGCRRNRYTVETAAASTGLSTDTLQQIVGHLGGEGALASVSGMLDRDGDGNPINDITSMIGGFFSKK
jgi:hypothetical protein